MWVQRHAHWRSAGPRRTPATHPCHPATSARTRDCGAAKHGRLTVTVSAPREECAPGHITFRRQDPPLTRQPPPERQSDEDASSPVEL